VFDVVLIDATETPIERPKKQRRYYSGKKKRHVENPARRREIDAPRPVPCAWQGTAA
jgi:hypothetical protein